MEQLENVTDEFIEWLDTCPVQWFLDGQDKDTVTYVFNKEIEE
jgi:hypothetical protein